ncbi:MAG: ABC transporter permease [Candidatus Eisenbacteria bacterium]|nr:ABC transporter permease [Candidatus Eisenbacteria bacterium]
MPLYLDETVEATKMAISALRANKMRSFLTILGVIIGVTTVMGMVSLIEGLNKGMMRQLASLGSDTIHIRKFKPGVFVGEFPDSLRHRKAFTEEDVKAVMSFCPSVKEVAPLNFTEAKLKYGSNETRTMFIIGSAPALSVTNELSVSQGRFFTETEVDHRAQVCVLGQDILSTLFPHANAVGKLIRIGNAPYTVVGELETMGKFLGQTRDDMVVVPYTTLFKKYGKDIDLYMNAKPTSPDKLDAAIDEITELLRRRRGIPSNKSEDFGIFTNETLMDLYHKITGAFYLVMIVISSIGLLVGGIGVMNIMLVSVRERTREIGLRKAIGARKKDILWQFLVEAGTLTGTGGILGIIIGLSIGKLIDLATPLPSAVPLWAIILGFSFSVGVGMFFGIYPAVKAASLDPVEALRYE